MRSERSGANERLWGHGAFLLGNKTLIMFRETIYISLNY
jgi:hypothetical protein